jgi:thiazole synthase
MTGLKPDQGLSDCALSAWVEEYELTNNREKFSLAGREFDSRLIVGTGKFSSVQHMIEAIRASATQLVTVSLRRFNPSLASDDLLGPLSRLGVTLIPNTSGARTAAEAVRAALLGRELAGSPFVKVEIHPNPHHLMPDPIETYDACRELVKEGCVVLPYMPADPVLAKRLEDIGCAAVMPLGSGIGTGKGLATAEMLSLIIANSGIPVIVDAGLRSPSEAAAAMEMGCEAVLVNSAIAVAGDPPAMAEAFAMAVKAGYDARRAGIMARSGQVTATSPLTLFLTES